MSSGSESSAEDAWEEAHEATAALKSAHQDTVERSLDADDMWDTTIGLIQLARSSGWNCHFLMLAMRQFIRLVVAASIQWCIMRYFGYSLLTMTPYGGQPWLCDMGKGFMDCDIPEKMNENCMGPGGTRYHKDTLFSDFGVWSTRVFARDSFNAVFDDNPSILNTIADKVDPGEYGLESYVCRYICLLLFAIQIQAELRHITDSIVIVSWLKCNSDPWLYVTKDEQAGFKHGGMNCFWKFFSFLIIAVRTIICIYTGVLGTRFLLNTAAIADLIFNSLALTFIFDLDEIIQKAWSTAEPKIMMGKLEPVSSDRRHCFTRFKDCLHDYLPLPIEMLFSLFLLLCWTLYIFNDSCQPSVLGGSASSDVYAVEYGHYSIFPWFWQKTYPNAQWCPPTALVGAHNCTLR